MHAAPIGVPCPSYPELGDPTHKPISYLCGMDVLAEDMWIGESFEAYDATIRTRRNNFIGVHMQSDQNGYLIMDNVQILMEGMANSAVVFSSPNPVGADLHDLRIQMAGERTVGINAGVTLPKANGELVRNNRLLLRSSRIDIEGRAGVGLVTGVNSGIELDRTTITTAGEASIGIGQWAGQVQVLGSLVDVEGARAVGIHAVSQLWTSPGHPTRLYSPELHVQDSSIIARGEGTVGILAEDRDRMPAGTGLRLGMVNARVLAQTGEALRIDGGADNTLSMHGGLLHGRDASIHLRLTGSGLRATLTDARIVSDGGSTLRLGERSVLALSASGSELEHSGAGPLLSLAANASASLQLAGTRLRGGVQREAGSNVQVAMAAGSRWDMTGGGVLDQLHLQDSTLSLADGQAGDRLHVLGDLQLQDGRIVLDTALEGDLSTTDHVRVDGDLSGQGTLYVHNAGGRGAVTAHGIEVVSVGGRSGASLALGGRAVGGQYEYFLHHDSADGGWYLRSELQAQEPCVVDPHACAPPDEDGGDVGPGQPPGAGTPDLPPGDGIQPPGRFILRPEVGAYLANQLAAVQLTTPADRQQRGDASSAAWARWENGQYRLAPVQSQLDVRGQRNRLQMGTDLMSFAEGRARVGVQATMGYATHQTQSRLTGFSASGRVRAAAVGVELGWTVLDGRAYLDAIVQQGQYQGRVHGQGLDREQLRGRSTLSGIEVGYRVALGQTGAMQWSMLPRLAVQYHEVGGRRHVERNGTQVQTYGNEGVSTRLGLRLQGQSAATATASVSPYLSLDWYHQGARGGMAFDQRQLSALLPRDQGDLMAGVTISLGERVAAWGGFGASRGSGKYREVRGELGLSWRW
ncbi:autotransporter outer membrane beta-barrel domain-containing protein [Stenotrophomonas sp. NA06056]|nr:autotransporter outer membrane beta-barrel domain-containing protein [Stenotrophomonas sp. NA06056]